MIIETGADLKRARQALGWSVYYMADKLELGGNTENGARRVRAIESGKETLWGPIRVAVEGFLREAGITTLEGARNGH